MTGWEPATDAEIALRDALRANDQESYFRILARTELLLPVSAEALAGRAPMGWGTWTTDGRSHVLAFTSTAAVRACLADSAGSTRRMHYQDLARSWPNLEWWLAVNPGLPIEGYLPAWFVSQLGQGDVRLPGRTSARSRLERVVRARATAAVPRPPTVAEPAVSPAEEVLGPAEPPVNRSAQPAVPPRPVSPAPAEPVVPPVLPVRRPRVVPGEPAVPVTSAPAGRTGPLDGEAGSAAPDWMLPARTTHSSPPSARGLFESVSPVSSGGSAPPERSLFEPVARERTIVPNGSRPIDGEPPPRSSAGGRPAADRQPGEDLPGAQGSPHPATTPAAPQPAYGSAEPAPVPVAGPADSARMPFAAPAPRPEQATVPNGSDPENQRPAESLRYQDALSQAPATGATDGSGPGLSGWYAAANRSAVHPGFPTDLVPSGAVPTDPVPVEPTRSEPVPSGLIWTDPVPAEPVPTDPVPVESTRPEPIRPDPDPMESTRPEPIRADPVPVEVFRPDPAPSIPDTGVPAAGFSGVGSPASEVQLPGSSPLGMPTAGPVDDRGGADPVSARPFPPDFMPANDVEQSLLDAVGTGSTDNFLSTLLLARVLLPVSGSLAPSVQPGDDAFPWRTETMDGETYVVGFTSPERLGDHISQQPVQTIGIKFAQLIRRWPDLQWNFAVNPGTPVGAKLPGAQIVALANWAAEVGLGDSADTEPAPAPAPPEERPRLAAPARPEPGRPTVMQKMVAPSQLPYYLDRGYDRVSGFVHRAAEIAHLGTPAELYDALGLGYPGTPFARDADEVYLLRWPAYRPSLYRIPYGGQNEAAMRAMEGWVIERAPFRGNGFAPGESSDVVAEFKVDSVRLPHGAELRRVRADGTEEKVAVLDCDVPVWRRVGVDNA